MLIQEFFFPMTLLALWEFVLMVLILLVVVLLVSNMLLGYKARLQTHVFFMTVKDITQLSTQSHNLPVTDRLWNVKQAMPEEMVLQVTDKKPCLIRLGLEDSKVLTIIANVPTEHYQTMLG